MKKILYGILLGLMFCIPGVLLAAPLNTPNPYLTPTDNGSANEVKVPGTDTGGQQDSLVNVIKGAVNWILGILALIALLILMYGGFLMVTSAGEDDGYKKGFTILKHAATGLILIGIAWFVISIIFWLVNQVASNPGTAGTGS